MSLSETYWTVLSSFLSFSSLFVFRPSRVWSHWKLDKWEFRKRLLACFGLTTGTALVNVKCNDSTCNLTLNLNVNRPCRLFKPALPSLLSLCFAARCRSGRDGLIVAHHLNWLRAEFNRESLKRSPLLLSKPCFKPALAQQVTWWVSQKLCLIQDRCLSWYADFDFCQIPWQGWSNVTRSISSVVFIYLCVYTVFTDKPTFFSCLYKVIFYLSVLVTTQWLVAQL